MKTFKYLSENTSIVSCDGQISWPPVGPQKYVDNSYTQILPTIPTIGPKKNEKIEDDLLSSSTASWYTSANASAATPLKEKKRCQGEAQKFG